MPEVKTVSGMDLSSKELENLQAFSGFECNVVETEDEFRFPFTNDWNHANNAERMAMDKMIMGENAVYSTDCSETGLNNNVIVCGTSGCGKTMSITEPILLEAQNSSYVVLVTKRKIPDKYRGYLRSKGYKVLDLDFVYPVKGNIGYDLLHYVKNYEDIMYLAEAIVNADRRKAHSKADPYWDEAAVSLLSAEIAYVKMVKEDASFSDVLEMHDHLVIKKESNEHLYTSFDKAFYDLADREPNCFAVSCWKSFGELPVKTARCVLGTLNTMLTSLFNPEVRMMMAMERQIDFEDLAKEKTVLFITTSPVNPALHRLINVFYGQLFKGLFEYAEKQPKGELRIPVHVVADDFATGGKILNFGEYISIFREKRISVTLLLQSESQLDSIYGYDDAKIIKGNCDTLVYMGSNDIYTAQHISQRLSVSLDEVLYMPVGDVIVFRRGSKPVRTTRYNILENELYKRITRDYEETMTEK